MKAWGVEVRSGESLKVQPGHGMILHLSQASIGEVKDKGSESICLFINFNGKKLVLGTLFSDRLPQQQFDLVFDGDFVLSHNWKSGSVYFYGYRASNPEEEEGDEGFDSVEEIMDVLLIADNGKPETEDKQEKPSGVEKAKAEKDSLASKLDGNIVEPNKDVKSKEDDEDVSTDEDIEEDEDETDSDSDDDSDEEILKKVASGKRRATELAILALGPDKKAKVATPQKTDSQDGGGHVETPHNSEQVGKTTADQSNQQIPKFPCSFCRKSFRTEGGLQAHTKDKQHGAESK